MRAALPAIAALLLARCADAPAPTPLRIIGDDPTDAPLASLTAAERARFDEGDALFDRVFRESQGLGPVYIRASCASCHEADGRGPGAVERRIAVEPDGFSPSPDQSAMPWGPVLRPLFTPPATRGITAPTASPTALLASRRVGPAVFGRGWMQSVDPRELDRVAATQRLDGRVRGRVPRLTDGSIGRFGLKSRLATLDAFAADALRGDMGITSPELPNELPNPEGISDDTRPGPDVTSEVVRALGAYVAGLAIPRRVTPNAQGRNVFERIGCADCHVPSLATGADTPVAAMANARAELYSDMLLHDMGSSLADGSVEGAAGPRDWRTAPLMGLRFFRAYLHDGRARSLDESVRMHRGEGSEANDAVDRYSALSESERRALLAFVEAL